MENNVITPFKSGLITDVDPWSIPADAFSDLENFAINHGRIEKRPGMIVFGQMVGVDNNPTTDRVMGIATSTDATGVNQTVAFTQTVMNYWDGSSNPGAWTRVDGGVQVFNGSDTDYYWTANWQPTGTTNRLFITNGKAYDGTYDGIRYWDYTTDPSTTVGFRPTVSTNTELWGGKLIFTFRGRLVVLNTYERNTTTGVTAQFPQRATWSQYQNSSNWSRLTAGQGGFVDAATGEHIISAQRLRDSIIVFFTDSVWSLYYTGDNSLPFAWKRLNAYRACGGKMASQAFDAFAASVGGRGIVQTTGSETSRMDDRIQDFTTAKVSTPNFNKVFCARSFALRRWWILYPRNETSSDECDGVLILNQDDQCWSTYTTTLNVLGYGVASFDYTCDSFTTANNREFTCLEVGDATCQDYHWQDDQNIFLGGDRNGVVYILEQTGSDNGTEITGSLQTGVLNQGKYAGQTSKFEYIDILTNTEKNTDCTISFYKDSSEDAYFSQEFNLLPPIGYISSIQNISQASPAEVTSFNHGLATGDQVYIYGVKGMISVNGGPYTITVTDTETFTLDGLDSTGFSAYTSAGGLYKYQFYRTKTWKRINAGGIGAQHQISLTSVGPDDSLTIYAFRPVFRPVGREEIY